MSYWTRLEDTIVGRITPSGVGAVGVVRVSGPSSRAILGRICPKIRLNLESHRAVVAEVFTLSGQSLDQALVVAFDSGKSFTGEESFEISLHGNPNLITQVIDEIVLAGARVAERGEFSFRAFNHGRIDLLQAESIQGLISAKSSLGRSQALASLEGKLSREIEEVSLIVERLLAHLEASIDFSEESLSIISEEESLNKVADAQLKIQRLLEGFVSGRRAHRGLIVSLLGPVNAGKSSLFNNLLGVDRAIVTSEEGTTRDLLESEFEVGGVSIRLRDTAGIRDTTNEVEKIGIQKSIKSEQESDLRIYVVGLDQVDLWIKDFFDRDPLENESWLVLNKTDLGSSGRVLEALDSLRDVGFRKVIPVSTMQNNGLKELKQALLDFVAFNNDAESALWSDRHFELIQKSSQQLDSFKDILSNHGFSPELLSIPLMESLNSLYELLGKRVDEAVIDRIFKEFCLGK